MKLVSLFAGYYVNHENKIEVSKTQGVWQVKRDEKHVDWYDSFAEAKKALVA